MKKIKTNLIVFLRFIYYFNVVKGTLLYIKFTRGKVNGLKIPGLKNLLYLRENTSDIRTFYQVFIRKEYNIKYNDDPEVILDCGANIGLFAILMKNQYPKARIICIEPDPENFELLQKNVSGYENVICENCGVWNRDTVLRVYDKYNLGKWGMVVEEDLINGTINALSIDSLLEKYSLNKVDILKVDIETSEKQLFGDNYDHWLPMVETIVIELHDRMEKGCSKTFFEAVNKCFYDYSFLAKGENVIIHKRSPSTPQLISVRISDSVRLHP